MQVRLLLYGALLSLMWLGIIVGVGGCSGKQVASSSGDASATSKEKGKSAAAPAEMIKPEPMVTIPDDQRATTESSREPLTSSLFGGDVEPGSTSVPSNGLIAAEGPGLGDIFFDFDQSVIRSDAFTVLDANAAWIRKASASSVLIEGHCDERGTLAYNLVLGEKRARSAKRYLEDLGIPGERLKITSFGEVKPVCHEHKERCWQKNRRAHFVAK